MLTFFTTAKPFRGHDGIIQRNALKSWKLLDSDVEVILFGEDEGAAQVCSELGLVHHPHVEQHAAGRNYLDYMFAQASQMARHEYLCYCNCDIVLMDDFLRAFERARAWRQKFLFVAQRWDTDITEPIDFRDGQWSDKLRQLALTSGFQQGEYWIDLFLFRKGHYLNMPRLIVGHCYWDTWMIWSALRSGIPVLDGTSFVMPIHQNHGYNPAFGRAKGSPNDVLSLYNLELIGGLKKVRHIKSSTHRLSRSGGIHKRLTRRLQHRVLRLFLGVVRGFLGRGENWVQYKLWLPIWHSLLDWTRPARASLGLRSRGARLREKTQSPMGNGK
jgi:hypothetical protein